MLYNLHFLTLFLNFESKISSESNDDGSNLSKKQWLELECQKPEYSSLCLPNQKWECVYDGYSHRMKKCRSFDSAASLLKDNCLCSNSDLDTTLIKDPSFHIFNSSDQFYQMKFLKEHINGHFKPLVLRPKIRRSQDASDSFNLEGVYDLSRLLDSTFNRSMSNKPNKSVEVLQYHEKSGCFIFSNISIVCPQEVYHNQQLWRRKKDRVDNLIKRLQLTLGKLKGIRRHLKHRRPGFSDERSRCECEAHNQAHLARHKFHRNNRKDNLKKKERKLRRKIKFENTTCNIVKMNCFTHNEFHWKTPPLWTRKLRQIIRGQQWKPLCCLILIAHVSAFHSFSEKPFCFCQNSNNNTFWCLRTINETHNFLYCEFITGFISYYDLNQDPYQVF
jgi:sulfatase-1, sulf-1, putative (fragment)